MEITDELLDRAATALARNLNLLLAHAPTHSTGYVNQARIEADRERRRTGRPVPTGHNCWKCGHPIHVGSDYQKLGRFYIHADCTN